MILYYALTTYHIQCCVLHKLTRKPQEKAVLLLSDIHQNSLAFLSRYKDSKIFDDVILLNEMEVNNRAKQNERKHRSRRSILNCACRDIKKILPIDVAKMDEIYLCPDHFPFGWYIIKNKIKYHCFEEGCGVLSDNKFMLSNMERNKAQYKLMDVLGYFGNNDSAVEILADAQCQIDGYHNDKMTDFSVKRTLEQLSPQQLSKVLKFFGVTDKIQGDSENLSLILTQHMANLGIMPLEEQHLIYKMFADYFLANTHIIVKPHPDDIAGRYCEIFGDSATVLPFAMPSELLPYALDGRIKTAIAAYSTAVKNLGDFCDRMICFDNRILDDFRYIHRYFACLMLISYLNIKNVITNANEILFDELSKTERLEVNFEQNEDILDKETAVAVSDKLLETRDVKNICNYLISGLNTETCIFLNEKNKHIYFDGEQREVFKHIRPITITMTDKNGKTTEDVIYLYSTVKKIIDKAETIDIKKELKYTGITLDIHSISRSESEKIKMLEGVLEATEERLKEYIANKKELDDEIEKLKKGK